MGRAARESWRAYREALRASLNLPEMLGEGQVLREHDDLPSIEAALDTSEDLERACLAEREERSIEEEEAEDQLLAGGMIDFLFAAELVLLAEPEVEPDLPSSQRRAHWRYAVAVADAAFGLGEDDPGGSALPPLFPSAGPSEAQRDTAHAHEAAEEEGPAVAGAAPGPYAAELRENCVNTADLLIERSAEPAARAGSALLRLGVGELAAVAADVLPSDLVDYLERAREGVRRRLKWALTAALRFVRKILASLGLDPTQLPGLGLGNVVDLVVARAEDGLTVHVLRMASAYGDFEADLDERLAGADPEPSAVLEAGNANSALAQRHERCIKPVAIAMLLSGTLVHLATAAGGPVAGVAVVALPIAYLLYLARRYLETLPRPFSASVGIPSIATRYA